MNSPVPSLGMSPAVSPRTVLSDLALTSICAAMIVFCLEAAVVVLSQPKTRPTITSLNFPVRLRRGVAEHNHKRWRELCLENVKSRRTRGNKFVREELNWSRYMKRKSRSLSDLHELRRRRRRRKKLITNRHPAIQRKYSLRTASVFFDGNICTSARC